MDRILIITSDNIPFRAGTKAYEKVVNEKIEKIEECGGEVVGIDYLSDSNGYLKNVVLWYECDKEVDL